jgi:hypothetical protein
MGEVANIVVLGLLFSSLCLVLSCHGKRKSIKTPIMLFNAAALGLKVEFHPDCSGDLIASYNLIRQRLNAVKLPIYFGAGRKTVREWLDARCETPTLYFRQWRFGKSRVVHRTVIGRERHAEIWLPFEADTLEIGAAITKALGLPGNLLASDAKVNPSTIALLRKMYDQAN